MKKFYLNLILLCVALLLCLNSCGGRARLYDVVLSATAADETLPAGSILCYGRGYDTAADAGFLDDYLGLAGYPAFRDKIEDFALYSSLSGDFCELCVMRLYRASDTQDGALFFKRRAAAAKRALNTAGGDVFRLPLGGELRRDITPALSGHGGGLLRYPASWRGSRHCRG